MHAFSVFSINLALLSSAGLCYARPTEAPNEPAPQPGQRFTEQYTLVTKGTGLLHHPDLGNLSQFHNILDSSGRTGIWSQTILEGGIPTQKTALAPGTVVDIAEKSDRYLSLKKPAGVAEVYKHDLMEPLPANKSGYYDLIHQHYAAHLEQTRWPQVLAHLRDGLRTNGTLHLDWLKKNFVSAGPAVPLPESLKAVNERILLPSIDKICSFNASTFDEKVVEGLLTQAGFVDVVAVPFPVPLGAAASTVGRAGESFTWLANELHGLKPLFVGTPEARDDMTVEEYDKLAETALKQVKEFGGYFEMVFVVARKA